MSISYEATGRRRQKSRTRQALIRAARNLIAASVTPTVGQAADAAGISRATAYRYFANQRDMLVAAHPEIDTASLLGAKPPRDTSARLDRVIDALTRMTIENELQLRTTLRLSLESDGAQRERLVLRQGRAIGWLEEALQPLSGRLPRAKIRRLVYAIRCAVGIEALIWLCDVGGLSRKDAAELMRWSSRALLQSALAEQHVKKRRRAAV